MEPRIDRITYGEKEYPNFLKMISDPPKTLYFYGDLSLANSLSVSLVGARKCSAYGRWAAYQLAKTLADYDVVTVSGMAYGIDTYAHKGAIDNQGKTIAVFGCGVDICYPSSNQKLMEKIKKEGLILSEFAPGEKPLPFHFPMRNRIISGLSPATVVVEAGLYSGSLITAELAAEQGRNIYAIPGNINSVYSIGANKLIKDGAVPLVVLNDIIDELGLERKIKENENLNSLGEDEKILYDMIAKNGEITPDYLAIETGKRIAEINSILTILEMKGVIQTSLGKIFIAK